MKIVFCGPSHSGKSVFIANLIDKLPTDAYTIVRACPDGEGNWSNNKNQKETSIVRKKGEFTKSFIDDACKVIDNQTNKIVLVDVGGIISKENEQVFKHCDSFVVLSNDEKKKNEWLNFGQGLGLECLGCLDSSLEGEEEIYTRKPYIQGRIVGLERGNLLEHSNVINAMVSDIVQKSRYGEKTEKENTNFVGTMVDDTQLGFALGYGKEIQIEDGTKIKQVKWSEKALPEIFKYIKEKVNTKQAIRINGIRANFVLCAICKALKKNGGQNISTYDARTKQYIPIKSLPKKKGIKQAKGLSYNIIESKENVFVDIDITKEQYSLEDYKQCVLPKIKENKNLYLSGKIPLWLLASISSSYELNKIFTFQPGKGFTCISATEEKELGTIVDGIDGINLDKYFEDKKNKNKKNLPTVIEKQGVISKISRLFAKVKENRENKKYLDDTLKANIITQTDSASQNKTKFQEELRNQATEQFEIKEYSSKRNISNTTISKD